VVNETKTLTLSQFLRDRLFEEQAMAQAAIDDDSGQDGGFEDEFDRLTKGRAIAGPLAFEPRFAEACARMIIWNTPRRVLEDIMSKRAIVDLHTGTHECTEIQGSCVEYFAEWEPCPTLRLLAAPYRNHPDYNPDWSVSDG